jgi:aldose 1-epimerase
MPFGLGHHPYFDKRPGTLLSAEVSGVWMPDATNIPRRLEPVPVEWGFRLRRPVEELTLDHIFQGWSGRARIDWHEQDRGVVLEADPVYPNLVVYVPPGRDFFCVEAVSHVGDGFNLLTAGVPDTGVRVLEPGEMLAGAMRFVPGPAAAPG